MGLLPGLTLGPQVANLLTLASCLFQGFPLYLKILIIYSDL